MSNGTNQPDQLSDVRRAALAARLRSGREGVVGIGRRGVGVGAPLSFGQEQLWFIDRLAPGLGTYNITAAFRLVGMLDVGGLGRALGAVLARHEALRSTVCEDGGRPRLVIVPAGDVELPVVDLGGLAADAREDALAGVAREEAGRPFSLERGPLLRGRLVRLAPDEHVLIVTVHHIVFDGWSVDVLLRELAAFYVQEVTSRPAQLGELPIQYPDYALWERERLSGPALDQLVAFWRERLDGAPGLELPTDRPRPAVQSYAGGVERMELGTELLAGLRALARREGTTLFVTMLTAFQALLSRYSGQEDVVVGTVSANRSRAELAPLIGYLVNILPIRTDLSGDPSFRELLGQVHANTLQAYAHQDLPFPKLVDALRVQRDPSRSPIFQVAFTLEETSRNTINTPNLTIEPLPDAGLTETSKFDLGLSVTAGEDSFDATAEFSSALFDDGSVRRLLGHLRALLVGVVEDSDRRVSELPLLTVAERDELARWNGTSRRVPAGCLHDGFEVQVARSPDATAAVLDGERLSYAELNRDANQLARRLRELGVGPDVLVGICMQRSLRRLVALMAVLKAGGGYLPLDPDYPSERLRFMLSNAAAPVVLTDEMSVGALSGAAAAIVSVDQEWEALARLDGGNLGVAVDPSDLAYVIYTSGSTGRPKGVMIEHRAAVNFIDGQIRRWALGAEDRILQFASLNFDVSVFDIFNALLSGATLCMGTTDSLLSPPRLAELIRRERVSVMCLPPAVLRLLAGEPFPDLRVVIAGGEAFSASLVKDWARPGQRFINGYGPTETTVGAIMMDCSDDTIDPPPIGHPLPNYTAYVLDRNLNQVPVGVPGELHIGGAGLARGYLHDPELTAQRFIPNPFSTDPGARLYKTGDIARRLPDGALQFLGRLDHQIKIRGFRVELGEIEALLTQHPGVAQAIVILGKDRAEQAQLLAYATPQDTTTAPSAEQLRHHLAEHLPPYMVPAHIITLDAFPLNGSGKVDRSALPEPQHQTGVRVNPDTILETLLADMFTTILNHPDISTHDNFFDLGGNSLQAMELIARLRNDLAIDADVTTIFLAPTITQLAERIEAIRASSTASDPGVLVRLVDGPERDPLFCVHPAGGSVHPYAHLARSLSDQFTLYGIEAAGLRHGAPVSSLEQMVGQYLTAVRAQQPHGPYRFAGWSMGAIVAFEMARALEAAAEEVSLLVLLDAPLPADAPVPSEEELADWYAADTAHTLGNPVQERDELDELSIADRLQRLSETVRGRTNGSVNLADIERRFAVYAANVRAIAGYRPSTTRTSTLIVSAVGSLDTSPGWSSAVEAYVSTRRIAGDHYSILQPPIVHAVASELRRHAASAERVAGSRV